MTKFALGFVVGLILGIMIGAFLIGCCKVGSDKE